MGLRKKVAGEMTHLRGEEEAEKGERVVEEREKGSCCLLFLPGKRLGALCVQEAEYPSRVTHSRN